MTKTTELIRRDKPVFVFVFFIFYLFIYFLSFFFNFFLFIYLFLFIFFFSWRIDNNEIGWSLKNQDIESELSCATGLSQLLIYRC